MPKKPKEKPITIQVETANEYCKTKTCCHKGHMGNMLTCEYILHIGKKRPYRISLCPGFLRKIIRTDINTGETIIFENVDEAVTKSNVTKEEIMRCIKKELSHVNGFKFRQERFPQESFNRL